MKFNLEKAKKIGLKMPKKSWEEYDQKELKMGIKVEKEHINDEDICAIIAAHHLDEIKDYYTRLHKMEEEAGIKECSPDKVAAFIGEDININNGLI